MAELAKEEASVAARGRSVAGIAFEGSLLLLGQRVQSGDMGGRWEFLGGKAEGAETLQEALQREFKEETGFLVTAGEVICIAEFEHAGKTSDLYAILVNLPAYFSIEDAALTEHTQLRWFNLEEIESLNLVDSDRKLLQGLKEWLAARA